MIHGRHFGGYTDLVMICVHFMLILKVKKEVDAKDWPSLSHQDGPIWAHVGPYGPSWTGLGEGVNFPSTFRKTIWTNLARFGSKTDFLMKCLDDSASYLLEKLKNHVIFTKNHNI